MSLQAMLDPAGFFHDDTRGRSALEGLLDPAHQDPLNLIDQKGPLPPKSDALGLDALLDASQQVSTEDHQRNAQIMDSILKYTL